MKDKKIVLFFVLLLFFSLGCVSKPEVHCCDFSKAKEGRCYFYDKMMDEGYQGEENCKIHYDEKGTPVFCEVDRFNYSICSVWERRICAENCSAVICGDLGRIIPQFGLRDVEKLNTTPEAVSDYFGFSSHSYVVGLLHAECEVVKMSPSVENALSKGAFLSPFRFGIGNSFEEYENYAYLFPFSDRILSEGTDRYTNYFVLNHHCSKNGAKYKCDITGEEYKSFYKCSWNCQDFCYSPLGVNYECAIDGKVYISKEECVENCNSKFDPSILCALNSTKLKLPNSPFADELGYVKHWYGGLFWADVDKEKMGKEAGRTFWSKAEVNLQYGEDGRTANVGVLKFAKEGSGLTAATIGIFGFKEIPTYYAYTLPRHTVYSSQIRGAGIAEFECLSSTDCASGLCSIQHYRRSACVDAVTDANIECGCSYEYGQLVCKPTRTASVPASDRPNEYVELWDGEVLGVSKAILSERYDEAGRREEVLDFTQPERISQPKASIVNGKVVIFLSKDVSRTIDSASYPLENNEQTRFNILHYCDILPKEWTGCVMGGEYVINFIRNCMSKEEYYKNDIAVCYPPKFGLDGSSIGDNWRDICGDLTDDDFCISQGENFECSAYASAAIVIRKNEDGNFGKCIFDDTMNTIAIREYGWCEPVTFSTIAVERLYPLNRFNDPTGGRSTDENLPFETTSLTGGIARIDLGDYGEGPYEDFKNNFQGYDTPEAINKRIATYCPILEILPPNEFDAFNPNYWEGENVGSLYKSGKVIRTGYVNAERTCGGYHDHELRCDAYGNAIGCKIGSVWGYYVDIGDAGPTGGVSSTIFSWPNYYPHYKYMKDKLTAYLVSGILPVVYATDPQLYINYIGYPNDVDPYPLQDYIEEGTFITRLLNDVYYSSLYAVISAKGISRTSYLPVATASLSSIGPVVTVIGYADPSIDNCVGPSGNRDLECLNLSERAKKIKTRALSTVVLPASSDGGLDGRVDRFVGCPNCLIALATKYNFKGNSQLDFKEASRIVGSLSDELGLSYSPPAFNDPSFCARDEIPPGIGEKCNELFDNTDVLVVEVSIDRSVPANIDNYEMFVQEMINLSKRLVYKFGKPSLIMVQDPGSADQVEFIQYLATQRARLANAGIMGVHLSKINLSTTAPKPVLDLEKYCGVEYAAEMAVGLKQLAYFESMNVSEECVCVPCTPYESQLGLCNGYYQGDESTGLRCSKYSEDDENHQVWPRNCFPSSLCIDEQEYGEYNLHCNIVSAGKPSYEIYDVSEVMENPELYADLIASLEGKKLCDFEKNETYSRIRSNTISAIPVLFSTRGGNETCVQPESPYFNFCGFDIPLKERDAVCWLIRK